MISIEAYRLVIGSFNNSSRQLNLCSICKGFSILSSGIIRLFRPIKFITIILLNGGDIEPKPVPTFLIGDLTAHPQ